MMMRSIALGAAMLFSAAATPAWADTVSMFCGASEYELCAKAAAGFKEKTGNEVKITKMPALLDDAIPIYQQLLAAQSTDADVLFIDVIWIGMLQRNMLDLKPLVPAEEVAQHFQSTIDAATTQDGRLVALPWYMDTGLMYYRKDLLEKYGKQPPKTWDELTETAKLIQEKERAAGNPDLWGFTWQGKSYEGLTCDAIEWVASSGGGTIIEQRDATGRIIRRVEIAPNGTEAVIIDRTRTPGAPVEPPRIYGPREVPPPPGADLDGGGASEAEIERALRAAPRGGSGGYSLNEIRRSDRLRQRVAAVDLDTITFPSGSSRVPEDQVWKLERIGRAVRRIVERWPGQVFLIEGHTDAIGTRLANQELSARRAASVAGILVRYFGVPPRNLVTEGYGEDYLKIPTDGPSRENRRVTIRNITPLLGR